MQIVRSLAVAATMALASCGGGDDSGSGGNGGGGGGGDGHGIGHVFVIVLENKGFAETFGENSPAPYFAKTLTAQGLFLTQYYGIGHLSLDNYIAMVSGQGPNAITQSDCELFLDFISTGIDLNGQAIGQGCVYPSSVKTVANQLQDAGLSWRGYMEDMGNDLERDGSLTCSHPPLNSQDGTQGAAAHDQYATRHNPFMYFHSIIDDQENCDAHVVPLTALPADLGSVATTPNFVFITPNLCNDGHDTDCANGDPGGLVSIDTFLQTWVPMIMASPAYQQDGLIVITFDEAEVEPGSSDASACCNEPVGPNTPLPGIFGLGGGRTGAVMLSPRIVEAGAAGQSVDTPLNHYGLLGLIERIFGLDLLGYANEDGNAILGDPALFKQ